MSAPRKTPAPVAPVPDDARLNEKARLYPWCVFTQAELYLMTGYPMDAISAAFNDPAFPKRFGKARPESVAAWVEQQPLGVLAKEVK